MDKPISEYYSIQRRKLHKAAESIRTANKLTAAELQSLEEATAELEADLHRAEAAELEAALQNMTL